MKRSLLRWMQDASEHPALCEKETIRQLLHFSLTNGRALTRGFLRGRLRNMGIWRERPATQLREIRRPPWAGSVLVDLATGEIDESATFGLEVLNVVEHTDIGQS
jgi:hypothetical protein